jgi:hypothetical protein
MSGEINASQQLLFFIFIKNINKKLFLVEPKQPIHHNASVVMNWLFFDLLDDLIEQIKYNATELLFDDFELS